MDLSKEYKRIRNAGTFAVWIGGLQLVLLAFVAWFLTSGSGNLAGTDRWIVLGVNVLVLGVQGTLLIIFGRKLRQPIENDPAKLDGVANTCRWIILTVSVASLIAALSGGRGGFLPLLLVLTTVWAMSAIKKIKAAGAAQVPAPPVAPGQPQ